MERERMAGERGAAGRGVNVHVCGYRGGLRKEFARGVAVQVDGGGCDICIVPWASGRLLAYRLNF